MQKARLKSDGYTCRTVRRRLADAGSNPASSTILKNQQGIRLVFFRLLPRVCAGSRGFLRTSPTRWPPPFRPRFALWWSIVSAAETHSMSRSPQRLAATTILINKLRADESSTVGVHHQFHALHLAHRLHLFQNRAKIRCKLLVFQ